MPKIIIILIIIIIQNYYWLVYQIFEETHHLCRCLGFCPTKGKLVRYLEVSEMVQNNKTCKIGEITVKCVKLKMCQTTTVY